MRIVHLKPAVLFVFKTFHLYLLMSYKNCFIPIQDIFFHEAQMKNIIYKKKLPLTFFRQDNPDVFP